MNTYRITCIDKWGHRLLLKITASGQANAAHVVHGRDDIKSVLEIEAA